ncbi:MAG: flagellar assembly peptidoglycan hydrolase FlgJ [Noviherbaspirillum sp.]
MIDGGKNTLSMQLAADASDLSALRRAARQDSPGSMKAAAGQFEALFLNMVMKSMRDATPQDSVFDSSQSKMYTSMLDQQLSQGFASRGVGLAEALLRQMEGTAGVRPVPPRADIAAPAATAARAAPTQSSVAAPAAAAADTRPAHVRSFEARLAAHAERASQVTGIPAKFMLGQAALESGWGRREIRGADGSTSHNLFGIKATGGWQGKVVEVATTEYINGVPQRRMEKFRAYDSYAESFADYAKLLSGNPRYRGVLDHAGDAASFAQGLQRAGYATDPQYAAKLTRIIERHLTV